MDFEHFLKKLDRIKAAEPDSDAAHDEILPIMAKERKVAFKNDPDPRISAVAATVYPKGGQAHLLLIERQSYKGVHSAQVGFPGGKREEGDRDLQATALREMEEELGVDRQMPVFVRPLSLVYIPPSRFLVHPFVYYLEELPDLVEDPREVKRVIQMPVAHLLDDANVAEGKIKMSTGVSLRTPYFDYGGFKIWGATAMMLSETKRIFRESL